MTPMMKQYWRIKSLHRDKILFFRMGDFYEMFAQDAETAAPILNIVLTARHKKSQNEIKMCGVPYHSIAGSIAKLLKAGLKVAVCDQVGSKEGAKIPIERKVTRILTPGMVYDPDSLNSLKAHYLCAFDEHSAAFADASTGEAFFYSPITEEEKTRVINLLSPAEMILTSRQKAQLFNQKERQSRPVSVFDEPLQPETENKGSAPACVQRILAYIRAGQGEKAVQAIRPFQKKVLKSDLVFSPQALEHLEVFKNYQGEVKNTLFAAVNRTKTPGGARLLRGRLSQPSTHQPEIEHRLNQIDRWIKQPALVSKLREQLSGMGDLERRLGKIPHAQYSGQEFLLLAASLKAGWEIISLCAEHFSKTANDIPPPPTGRPAKAPSSSSYETHSVISHWTPALFMPAGETAKQISEKIFRTIKPSPQGGFMIREGVSTQLDGLVQLVRKKHASLQQLEAQERRRAGIPTLKISYNNIFGYYIEITKVHGEKVPSNYIRKQTLTQAERYITPELQQIEGEILSTRARALEMEKQIFESLRAHIIQYMPDVFYLSRALCEIDVSTAFARLAIERAYTRPQFNLDHHLLLVNSRHPVVEQNQNAPFVPNTIQLNKGECLLLTGPNMAGKSTLMRQAALSAVLAQAGCFVPAERAVLPLLTQLFTRIGARDLLSEGLSTFMVEMKESAHILKHADARSLVILDEIGRGTATYDGMSLAQAMVEYLVVKKQSFIFFATHYRELTLMAKTLPQVKNARLNVQEQNGLIHFLYTLSYGAAAGSYGVQVAALAGFPKTVVKRALKLLKHKEQTSNNLKPSSAAAPSDLTAEPLSAPQPELF